MERRQLLPTAIAFGVGVVLLAWGLGAVLGTPAFGNLRLAWPAARWGLLACVPLFLGLSLCLRSRWPPFVRLRRRVDEVVALFAPFTVPDLALLSALAGIGEEALFRGVMQTALADALGLPAAIILTSVVFGLAHCLSVPYAVYAFVVSVYLGVLLIAFDNLLVPVTAHAAYDFAALVYLLRVRHPDISP